MYRVYSVLLAVLLCVVFAAGCTSHSSTLSSSTDDLTKRARIVGDQGADARGGANGYPMVWLTDNQVLQANLSWSHGNSRWRVLNLDNGSECRPCGLAPTNSGELTSASPDGKWVSWCNTSKGSGLWTVSATRLEDGKTINWHEGTNGMGACWLGDSHHIVSVGLVDAGISAYNGRPYSAPGITILDTASGSVIHKLVPEIGNNIEIVRPDKSDNLIMSGSPTFDSRNTSSVTLYRLNIHSNPLSVQTLNVPVPNVPGSQNGTFYAAPAANRIIWHYTTYHKSLTDPMFKQGQPTVYDDFYVTRIDGSGLRRIGRLTDANCQWMMAVSPDGDKIGVNIRQEVAVITLPAYEPGTGPEPVWTQPSYAQYSVRVAESPAQLSAREKYLFKILRAEVLSNRTPGHPLAGTCVNSVAVSGSDVYAGTDQGLTSSRDAGKTWSTPANLAAISISCLASTGATAYAGTDDGLFASRDGGVTWREDIITRNGKPLGAVDGPRARDVLNVACSGSTVCVLTMAKIGGFYVSHDDGVTWRCPQLGGGKFVDANSIAISGSNIYIGTNTDMYVSRDGGATFRTDNSLRMGKTGQINVYGVAASGSAVYAVVVESLYVSYDSGGTWTDKEGFMDYGKRICASGSTVCKALNSNGASISLDCGGHWQDFGTRNGLASNYANDVAISGSTICVATNRGLSITNNHGSSWTTVL